MRDRSGMTTLEELSEKWLAKTLNTHNISDLVTIFLRKKAINQKYNELLQSNRNLNEVQKQSDSGSSNSLPF